MSETAPQGVPVARLRSAADLIKSASQELEHPGFDRLPAVIEARSHLAAAAMRLRLPMRRAQPAED
jgi:hypothetical protein